MSESRVDEASGDLRLDQDAKAIMLLATFRPAMIEGIPLETWVTLPVTFRPVSRRSGGGG